MVKLKVREQTVKYVKTKNAKMSREEEELEKRINIPQRQCDSGCSKDDEKLAIHTELEEKLRN